MRLLEAVLHCGFFPHEEDPPPKLLAHKMNEIMEKREKHFSVTQFPLQTKTALRETRRPPAWKRVVGRQGNALLPGPGQACLLHPSPPEAPLTQS